VSKKSRPSFCLNPCTTSLALCFSIVPSVFNFLLKIHLHPSALHLCGRSTSSHVWFCIMESISLFTAFFHEGASGVDMASLNVFGSFSKRNVVINSSPNDFFLMSSLATSRFIIFFFFCRWDTGTSFSFFTCSFWIFSILARKHIFKERSISGFHYCIHMYIWHIRLVYQKSISTTVVCIPYENTVNGFRSYCDPFRRWYCHFC